jgi:hypothetical protein
MTTCLSICQVAERPAEVHFRVSGLRLFEYFYEQA